MPNVITVRLKNENFNVKDSTFVFYIISMRITYIFFFSTKDYTLFNLFLVCEGIFRGRFSEVTFSPFNVFGATTPQQWIPASVEALRLSPLTHTAVGLPNFGSINVCVKSKWFLFREEVYIYNSIVEIGKVF